MLCRSNRAQLIWRSSGWAFVLSSLNSGFWRGVCRGQIPMRQGLGLQGQQGYLPQAVDEICTPLWLSDVAVGLAALGGVEHDRGHGDDACLSKVMASLSKYWLFWRRQFSKRLRFWQIDGQGTRHSLVTLEIIWKSFCASLMDTLFLFNTTTLSLSLVVVKVTNHHLVMRDWVLPEPRQEN